MFAHSSRTPGERSFTYVSVVITLFSALTVGSVIVLRYKRPELPRPYKLWGYPIVPILLSPRIYGSCGDRSRKIPKIP